MGSFSIWHWLIVLVIVALVFGTKKLGNIGKDLGSAVKGFKEGMREGEAPAPGVQQPAAQQQMAQQPLAQQQLAEQRSEPLAQQQPVDTQNRPL